MAGQTLLKFLNRHPYLPFAILWLCCLPAIGLACLFGQMPITPANVLGAIAQLMGFAISHLSDTALLVIQQIRLPRALAAFLTGGSLAIAGVVLQGCLRNSLADPFTLGISSGAACGASLAIAFGASLAIGASSLAIALSALAGSILALALALLLGRGGMDRQGIILAGVAVASFLGAIVAMVKALNEESVTSIVFWILGSFQGITWQRLPLLLATLLPGLLVTAWGWRKLDILSLGDAESGWLGLNAPLCRFWLLLGASIMTAGCVAIAGVIGFVGLVAPHTLRLLMGVAHGPLLLAAFPAGGLFLLFCDSVARVILDGGQELPVGVITALTGAPFFAFLICRRAGHD